METIGIVEATERFAEIARRVQQTGEAVRVIDGRTDVVEIVRPPARRERRRSPAEAFAALSRLRDALPKSTAHSMRDDIAEGRQ